MSEHSPSAARRLREKHQPISQNRGKIGSVSYCAGCKTRSGVLASLWPCEVIEALDDGEIYRQFFDDVETTYARNISDREVIDALCDHLVEVINVTHPVR